MQLLFGSVMLHRRVRLGFRVLLPKLTWKLKGCPSHEYSLGRGLGGSICEGRSHEQYLEGQKAFISSM